MGATATVLGNGDVLVAGGADNNGASLNTAELYEQQSNRWTPTGSMTQDRAGQTATLLTDGRVLVVGGQCSTCGAPTSTAEIYNPATQTWSLAPAMSVGRYGHTATMLQDGRVLVAGGYGGLGGSSFGAQIWASAEIYDPATNSWSSAGTMSSPRFDFGATLLKNGDVLVTGGEYDESCACVTASADLYNPPSNSWSATSAMLLPRRDQQQYMLANGQVITIGGWNPSTGASSEVEIYDPRAGTWTPGPSTITPTEGVTSGVLEGGRILLAGGYQGSDPQFSQMYLPARQEWVAAGDTVAQRISPVGVPIAGGRFLLAGGYSNAFPTNTTASAELFNG